MGNSQNIMLHYVLHIHNSDTTNYYSLTIYYVYISHASNRSRWTQVAPCIYHIYISCDGTLRISKRKIASHLSISICTSICCTHTHDSLIRSFAGWLACIKYSLHMQSYSMVCLFRFPFKCTAHATSHQHI